MRYKILEEYKKMLAEQQPGAPLGAISTSDVGVTDPRQKFSIYTLFKPGEWEDYKEFDSEEEMEEYREKHPEMKRFCPHSVELWQRHISEGHVSDTSGKFQIKDEFPGFGGEVLAPGVTEH